MNVAYQEILTGFLPICMTGSWKAVPLPPTRTVAIILPERFAARFGSMSGIATWEVIG